VTISLSRGFFVSVFTTTFRRFFTFIGVTLQGLHFRSVTLCSTALRSRGVMLNHLAVKTFIRMHPWVFPIVVAPATAIGHKQRLFITCTFQCRSGLKLCPPNSIGFLIIISSETNCHFETFENILRMNSAHMSSIGSLFPSSATRSSYSSAANLSQSDNSFPSSSVSL